MRELSIIIPVMNEEDNVEPMVKAVSDALREYEYELIFVDDGSTGATKKRIRELLNERIILIELRKNYGQSTAIAAGIDHSTGQYIAMLCLKIIFFQKLSLN